MMSERSLLYERIEAFCEYRGISIAEMCRAAKISPGIITDLKSGRKKSVKAETAIKIALALEISVEFLYSWYIKKLLDNGFLEGGEG